MTKNTIFSVLVETQWTAKERMGATETAAEHGIHSWLYPHAPRRDGCSRNASQF